MSRWFVGSSSRRISGALASSRAMASRARQPPDRRSAGMPGSVNPALPRVSVTRRCRSWSSSRPSAAIAPATISAADIPGGKTGVCGTWPMRRFFRRLQVPESGLSTPARILKSVDLPAPLGPTSPTWSPSWRANVNLSNSGGPPNDLVTASQLRSAGRGMTGPQYTSAFARARRHSSTRPRSALNRPRLILPLTRLIFEPWVAFVGRRGRGTAAAAAIRARRRVRASSRFVSRLRVLCALITTTPSALIRWSFMASSRALTASGRDEARMSNRRWTALLTLLTFWPPAPWARMASISTSLGFSMMRDALSKNHLHLVLATVVGQGDQPLSRKRCSVKNDTGHTAADTLRVLHGDPVEGAAVTVGDLEALPPSGDARIDTERGSSLPEAEHPLQARAVQPARRPGVPRPSPSTHVRRLGIDVRGHDVRLQLVRVDVRLPASAADRVQKIEEVCGLVSFADFGERDQRPDRGVGVLSAVFPDARRVSFYIPGVEGCPVEGRREEQQEPGLAPDEMTFDGPHGLACARAVTGTGEDRPGLRDGVDPALVVRRRPERRSIVEKRPPVPLAVPRLPLERSLEGGGSHPPPRRAPAFRAPVGDRGELSQVREEKPAQPDALSPALVAHTVHPVVPIPATDQGQVVAAHLETSIQGPRTMLEQRRPFGRFSGLEVGFLLPVLESRAFEPRNLVVEHRSVPGRLEITGHRIGKPEAVVGDPGPHPAARGGMPPVLDIPFRKLPGRGPQEVLAHEIGSHHRQGQDVLDLVAEAVGPTGLVERGPGPDATRERLVEKPAVEKKIQGGFGSLDLHGAQNPIPVFLDLAKDRDAVHLAVPLDHGSGL